MVKGDFTCDSYKASASFILSLAPLPDSFRASTCINKATVLSWLRRYIILHRGPNLSVGPAKKILGWMTQRTDLITPYVFALWSFALGGTTWSQASRSRSLFPPFPRWGLGILLASSRRDCGPQQRKICRRWRGAGNELLRADKELATATAFASQARSSERRTGDTA